MLEAYVRAMQALQDLPAKNSARRINFSSSS
jgi:hypothetical protein